MYNVIYFYVLLALELPLYQFDKIILLEDSNNKEALHQPIYTRSQEAYEKNQKQKKTATKQYIYSFWAAHAGFIILCYPLELWHLRSEYLCRPFGIEPQIREATVIDAICIHISRVDEKSHHVTMTFVWWTLRDLMADVW